MNSQLKLLVERALAASPLTPWNRQRRRNESLVLAYHNVVDDGWTPRGDRSLHLTRGAFARHLDLLLRDYDVVALEELQVPGRRGRPRIAITFDDAYVGALTIALEELRLRSLPALMFTAPGILGGRTMWWDQVGSASPAGVPEAFRERSLDEFAGQDSVVMAHARKASVSLAADPELRTATATELEAAMRYDGLSLASHSWSHPNLARVGGDELGRELRESLQWLRQRFSRVHPWISYPYGLSSAAVEQATEAAGYELGFCITPGWVRTPRASPWRVSRLNVPSGISEPRLAIRIAGAARARV